RSLRTSLGNVFQNDRHLDVSSGGFAFPTFFNCFTTYLIKLSPPCKLNDAASWRLLPQRACWQKANSRWPTLTDRPYPRSHSRSPEKRLSYIQLPTEAITESRPLTKLNSSISANRWRLRFVCLWILAEHSKQSWASAAQLPMLQRKRLQNCRPQNSSKS